MKKVKKIIAICGLTLVTALVPVLYASAQTTWSNEIVFTVNPGIFFSARSSASNVKSTNDTIWDLHHVTRTMSSRPQVRMVNSNNTIRSNQLTVANNDHTTVNSGRGGNLASNGEVLHVQARAAANQITFNQSLRILFSAR